MGDEALVVRGERAQARLEDLAELKKLYVEAEELYQSLCLWFHEGVQRSSRPSDEFFGVWDGFLQAVRVSLETIYGGKTKRYKAPLGSVRRSFSAGDERPPGDAGK